MWAMNGLQKNSKRYIRPPVRPPHETMTLDRLHYMHAAQPLLSLGCHRPFCQRPDQCGVIRKAARNLYQEDKSSLYRLFDANINSHCLTCSATVSRHSSIPSAYDYTPLQLLSKEKNTTGPSTQLLRRWKPIKLAHHGKSEADAATRPR